MRAGDGTTRGRTAKTIVCRNLQYYGNAEGDAGRINVADLRGHLIDSVRKLAVMIQLRSFVGSVEWLPAEIDMCTTWLELYCMYRLQGGEPFCLKRTPLDKPIQVNEEIRAFKAAAKKLRLYNVASDKEWML